MATLKSALSRLQEAFKRLNQGAFIALTNIGNTQDEAWDEIREEVARRGLAEGDGATSAHSATSVTCVFWHRQSHKRAFDKAGNLSGALVLHWQGDKSAIANLLQTVPEVEITVPTNDKMGFVVREEGAPTRPDPSRSEAVIEYLERMDLTPEVLLDPAGTQWLVNVATSSEEEVRLALLGAVHNERELPKPVIDAFYVDEATLVDEDSAFDYLNLLARNDRERYREVVMRWAVSAEDWQRYEAAFLLGDSDGRLAGEEGIALIDRLMQDHDNAVAENAVRSWMLQRSGGTPEARLRLCLEVLQDASRSKLVKRFAASNVALVSEMTPAQATQILEFLAKEEIQLDRSDLAHFRKRAGRK